MSEHRITYDQVLWLHSRGGRYLNDVYFVDGKMGVFMRNKGQDEFVPIPSNPKVYIKGGYVHCSR